jgi:Flp pilus assembly CpaE family ATPase
MSVAGLLAKCCKKKVLLMEADLYSGPLSVLLDLNGQYSLAEALGLSQSLDDDKWSQLITSAQGIDILPTPRDGRIGAATAWDCQRVMSFASTRYDCTVVDLPDVISDLTEPVTSRADSVYVVTTPEMASLFLARRRLMELQTLGVPPEKLGVVLNRHTSRDVPVADAANYLENPITLTLPDDVPAAREATIKNAFIGDRTSIGRVLANFAAQIAGGEAKGKRASNPSLMRNVLGVFDRRLGKVHS